MYKILSLNGGGIRGIITASVVHELSVLLGGPIRNYFDLIVGTSSGALLTAGLDHLPELHMLHLCADVLPKAMFEWNPMSFWGMMGPLYKTETKEQAIRDIFSDKMRIKYAIVSYDMVSRRPVVFNNLEDIDERTHLFTTKYSVKDACIASSAAPIFWHPYQLDNMILVDGAYAMNNPTLAAIKLAVDKSRGLDELLIVNIGSGYATRRYKMTNGGCPGRWMIPTLNTIMQSQSQVAHMLLHDERVKYYNFDIPLNKASDDIDDISQKNIENLELEAAALINSRYRQLQEVASLCS